MIIKSISGLSVNLHVPITSRSRVRDIKKALFSQEGIAIQDQLLFFNGLRLQDQAFLMEHKIESNSIIFITLKPSNLRHEKDEGDDQVDDGENKDGEKESKEEMKTHGENDKSQVKIKEHNVSEHNVSEVKVEEPKVEQQKHDFQHNCGRSTFCEVALRMKKIIKDVNKEEKPLLKNDECCICLQGYNSNTTTTSVSCSCAHYPVEIINCGHTIHAGCYIALVNENKFGCPQCTVVPPQFFGSIFMK